MKYAALTRNKVLEFFAYVTASVILANIAPVDAGLAWVFIAVAGIGYYYMTGSYWDAQKDKDLEEKVARLSQAVLKQQKIIDSISESKQILEQNLAKSEREKSEYFNLLEERDQSLANKNKLLKDNERIVSELQAKISDLENEVSELKANEGRVNELLEKEKKLEEIKPKYRSAVNTLNALRSKEKEAV